MKITEYIDAHLKFETNDCKFVDSFGNELEKIKLKKQFDMFDVIEVKYELVAIIKVKWVAVWGNLSLIGRFFHL